MTRHSSYRHTSALLRLLAVAMPLLLIALSSCRRDLYVYGDEFYSVTLDVDWRDFDSYDPDGMTVWFYNLDEPGSKPYRTTTANVRHENVYLANGRYQGVIVSYSPEEYSRQQFLDLDDIANARVEATPASYQPEDLVISGAALGASSALLIKEHLYGHPAWNDRQPRSELSSSSYYVLANQPEAIGADTIDNRNINVGSAFDDYILLKDRDTYQSSINVISMEALPHTLVTTMRIRVYISEGLNNLWTTLGSISGLSDGHQLPWHVNTENACLISLDEWSTERTGKNEGWISISLTTFGLRPATRHGDAHFHPSTVTGKSLYDGEECDIEGYYTDVCDSEDLRLNLAFILRDQHTVLTYHFNVGEAVVSYDDQLVLRVELDANFLADNGGPIVLPEVEAYGGTGFGADVTPWQDVAPVDIEM